MLKLTQQQTELQARLDRINAMLCQTESELNSWQDFIEKELKKKPIFDHLRGDAT